MNFFFDMKPSYLEKDEEEILKERGQLGKLDIIVILTNIRIIFLKIPKEIINSVKYNQITKIQNSKPSDKKIDEQTVSKIRIIDQKGIKIDFSFKGLESVNKSKKVTSLINKKRKEAEKAILDNKENEDSQEDQQSDSYAKDNIKKDPKKMYMSENTLKATFLEQSAAAKKMFKDLVVEEQILTEEEFWNNFKSEIAEQKALYQKNGYIFEEDQPKPEPADDSSSKNVNQDKNNEDENAPIVTQKIEDNIQNLNAVKMEQETVNNSEFKSSISIPEVLEPVLPDDDAYNIESKIDIQEENEINEENNEEDEIEEPIFIRYQEVVEPLYVDPDEFRESALNFYSKLETFSNEFNSLPEIVLPPMKIAKSIIFEISNENYRRFRYTKTTNNPEIIAGLETLRKHKMEQQILLVHFWQNYENIEDQHSREKALRLKGKIFEFKNILEDEKSAIKSKEALKALLPLYEEIEKSIFKVLETELVDN